ncbi:hypothetical protein Y1Q_0000648 [Alligator mississippiensis]|uniref:Uncharacterized protein n=1 Tax=Alligator mississippiensis TaxID=8496 RepID=A0A151MC96_ALLMI|nr:hypothetical protein Y1Q_0000648 [Alligator mississippiensis]
MGVWFDTLNKKKVVEQMDEEGILLNGCKGRLSNPRCLGSPCLDTGFFSAEIHAVTNAQKFPDIKQVMHRLLPLDPSSTTITNHR